MQFCIPVHRPAASGPATVNVIAHTFDEHTDQLIVTQISIAIDRFAGAVTHAIRNPAAPTIPATVNVLRTRVGVAPLLIHASASPPHTNADNAAATYDPPATIPILPIEKCRSRSR